MKLLKLTLGLLLALTFSTQTAFARSKKDKGQIAYDQGHYKEALDWWSKKIQVFEKRGKTEKCPYYTEAGATALKLGNYKLARKYLEAARYSISENATTYDDLVVIYRHIKNLSKEMDALQTYVKKYPQGKNIVVNRNRLYLDNVEATNWQDVVDMWPKLPDSTQKNINYRNGLLKAYVGLNQKKEADNLAEKLIKVQPKNVTALKWMAKKYFWMAEKSYRAENKAYAKNRTRRQYAHLLKAYKVITANFKKSLRYFKVLFPLDRTSQNAVFMSDIYGRLTDKKKADYYKALAKKLK